MLLKGPFIGIGQRYPRAIPPGAAVYAVAFIAPVERIDSTAKII